jgi:hypothetical protein
MPKLMPNFRNISILIFFSLWFWPRSIDPSTPTTVSVSAVSRRQTLRDPRSVRTRLIHPLDHALYGLRREESALFAARKHSALLSRAPVPSACSIVRARSLLGLEGCS